MAPKIEVTQDDITLRTWVRPHTRWNDLPDADHVQHVVWVKEPLKETKEDQES